MSTQSAVRPQTLEEQSPPEPVYQLEHVTKTYGQGHAAVVALNNVSLTVGPREFVAIEGPSGSGKSTLLQQLGVLDRPSGGRVMFEGRDLAKVGDAEQADLRRVAIGFVFQHFNLIPTLTAVQNVEAALAPSDLSSAARHRRAGELIERVGLSSRAQHLPSQLSGGEQQRVAIARSLANNARVLLADEPTGNLDTSTGADVMSTLHRLWQDDGLTMIVITHDPAISTQAPRVLRMQDGRIVSDSAPPGGIAAS
jgi:putative ABC transport system ATP-binding protein